MTDKSSDGLLEALQDWYRSNCDGDWEHEFGIRIENIDNPGWAVSVPLAETPLERKPFVPVRIQRTENDWLVCRVEDATFRGDGGASNLSEIIAAFLDWAHGVSQ